MTDRMLTIAENDGESLVSNEVGISEEKRRVLQLTEHGVEDREEGRDKLSNVESMVSDLTSSVPEGKSVGDEDSWEHERWREGSRVSVSSNRDMRRGGYEP